MSNRLLRWIIASITIVSLVVTSLMLVNLAPSASSGQVEPNAGSWKTWVLTSGSQLRLPAPPDKATSDSEIKALKDMVPKRDAAALDQIAFWDTSSPSYRWNEIAVNEALKKGFGGPVAWRMLSMMHVAIYDALVAAWDSKYTHNRARPSVVDPTLPTVIPNPQSPSYPSEYAVTAGAASTVLGYIFLDDAAVFTQRAQEAGQSRLLAGVEYPSDVQAGMELGQKVGALVVERGKADGSDAKWTGSVPTEKGKWNGTNPIIPTFANWKTWVLTSGSQFRPGPPPAYDSDQEKAELAEVLNYKRTPQIIADALFWDGAAGGFRHFWYWSDVIDRKIFEYRLDSDAPRAARAYALLATAYIDSGIACYDAKYTYWAIRPIMLDPNVKPVFTTQNQPGYPAATSCIFSTAATVLTYLFPRDAAALNALADAGSEAQVAAGVQFRSDIVAGKVLGGNVAHVAIDRAKSDGSE